MWPKKTPVRQIDGHELVQASRKSQRLESRSDTMSSYICSKCPIALSRGWRMRQNSARLPVQMLSSSSAPWPTLLVIRGFPLLSPSTGLPTWTTPQGPRGGGQVFVLPMIADVCCCCCFGGSLPHDWRAGGLPTTPGDNATSDLDAEEWKLMKTKILKDFIFHLCQWFDCIASEIKSWLSF